MRMGHLQAFRTMPISMYTRENSRLLSHLQLDEIRTHLIKISSQPLMQEQRILPILATKTTPVQDHTLDQTLLQMGLLVQILLGGPLSM